MHSPLCLILGAMVVVLSLFLIWAGFDLKAYRKALVEARDSSYLRVVSDPTFRVVGFSLGEIIDLQAVCAAKNVTARQLWKEVFHV